MLTYKLCFIALAQQGNKKKSDEKVQGKRVNTVIGDVKLTLS